MGSSNDLSWQIRNLGERRLNFAERNGRKTDPRDCAETRSETGEKSDEKRAKTHTYAGLADRFSRYQKHELCGKK